MAKSTHDRQLARAREKRQHDVLERRRQRSRIIVALMVGLLVLSLVGVAAIGALGGGDPAPVVEDAPSGSSAGSTESPAGSTESPADAAAAPEGACPSTPDDVPEVDSELYDAAPELTIDPDAEHRATVTTTCGDIVLELDASAAPLTVNNFVFLAEEGYYDGVGFHRVIDGFVAQAGDPAGTGCGRDDCSAASVDDPAFPGYTFEDELDLAEELVADGGVYPQGTLAMANGGPDTNGSQWFIVEAEDGVALPPDYTAFGRVLEGQDVVESIVLGPVEGDAAIDPVVIRSITIETT